MFWVSVFHVSVFQVSVFRVSVFLCVVFLCFVFNVSVLLKCAVYKEPWAPGCSEVLLDSLVLSIILLLFLGQSLHSYSKYLSMVAVSL